MTINVHRRGAYSRFYPGEQIGTAGVIVENNGLDGNHFRLWLTFGEARGFGNSHYRMEIEPESFRALALAMIRADRDEAIKAFGAALQAKPVPIERNHQWSPLWAEEKAA